MVIDMNSNMLDLDVGPRVQSIFVSYRRTLREHWLMNREMHKSDNYIQTESIMTGQGQSKVKVTCLEYS